MKHGDSGLSSLPSLSHYKGGGHSIGGVRGDSLDINKLTSEYVPPADWSLGLRRNNFTNTFQEVPRLSKVGSHKGFK